ncbi:unnamed protein product [Aureobasidium pullulans]|nr:unnamed protein product [Aureobasidium pullulans]
MAYPSNNITFAVPAPAPAVTRAALTVLRPLDRPETPPQPSCFVPYGRDPDFVDRGTLLDQLRRRCAAPASRVALIGLGGVGKSQLAIEHCYRTAEESPETWVFWAHASNTARLEQSFREIADQVKVRGHKDPQADVFRLVHDWLRDKKNGQWLLVLDNADDATVLSPPPSNGQTWSEDNITDGGTGGGSSSSALQQHLSRYLPPSTHGSVLLTSRTRRAALEIVDKDSDILPIEPMHDATAHALLCKKLGDKVDRSDGISELAAALEYMPLALVQAAAFIRERAPRSSVQQYLAEYRESDSRKTSLLNRAAGHLRRDKAASNSPEISSRPAVADELLRPTGIQEALLRNPGSTADNDSFEDDVLTLRDYSFITVTMEANTFEMHDLVQLATRTWLGNQDAYRRTRELAQMPGVVPSCKSGISTTASGQGLA